MSANRISIVSFALLLMAGSLAHVAGQRPVRDTRGTVRPDILLETDRGPAITVPEVELYTCVVQETVTLHVNARADEGGNGEASAPFNCITEALSAARERRLCSVELILANGSYFLGPHRPIHALSITGQSKTRTILFGSLRNTAGHDLTLRSLNLRNGQDVGVLQNGGELVMENVTITATRTSPGNLASGRGVIVQMRARATLNDVLFFANAGHSLLAEGVGTEVFAAKLSVMQSRVNPEAWAQGPDRDFKDTAAVEIRNGAALYVERLKINEPQGFGLRLHNRAKAHIKNGHFQNARRVKTGGQSTGGINVSVAASSILELGYLISENAELSGVSLTGGFVTVTGGGYVRNNPVGIHISPPPKDGYNVDRCFGRVKFVDNGTTVDGYLPLPDTPDLGDGPQPEPFEGCPRVAWP